MHRNVQLCFNTEITSTDSVNNQRVLYLHVCKVAQQQASACLTLTQFKLLENLSVQATYRQEDTPLRRTK